MTDEKSSGAAVRAGGVPRLPDTLVDLAKQFIAHYTADPEAGCGNCGGLPHTVECFVARFEAAVRAGGVSPDQLVTNDEVIVIREAVRSLDCGDHYCRYCAAKSPLWAHSEHCPYVRSQTLAEQARIILDRIQAAVRAGGVPGSTKEQK